MMSARRVTLLGLLLLAGWAGLWPRSALAAAPNQRFYTVGDGILKIRSTKNRHRFSGRFRRADGSYIVTALRRINRVFGAQHAQAHSRVSLRLIELLSHLQSTLSRRRSRGWVTISSGYRSPRYNRALRDKGGIVAKSSLHQYGMAADLRIGGVVSKRMWAHVKQHKLGGAGYYGSPWVHLDVGRPRSWTGGTAGVRKGLSDHNKRVILVPRHDIHRGGDTLHLRFARMTAWPIGVGRTFTLERSAGTGKSTGAGAGATGEGATGEAAGEAAGEIWKQAQRFKPRFTAGKGKGKGKACVKLNSIAQMTGIAWRLPAGLAPGRYRVRATFCDVSFEAMPGEVRSFVFSVAR